GGVRRRRGRLLGSCPRPYPGPNQAVATRVGRPRSDAHPEIGVVAPTPGETAVSLVLHVDDADRVLAAAEAAGARRDREPYDGYGLRNAWMVDPFGHRWLLSSPVRQK
ncbi:MAG: VOC family protein, partial [Nocardioidaceae bacterium]